MFINNNDYYLDSNDEDNSLNNNFDTVSTFKNLESSSTISLLENPFTKNFELLRNFFEINYKSNLDFDISTYYRYGDSNGEIIDGTIFSEDNLLYYNSLMEMDEIGTFNTYLDLKETSLWYEGDINEYKYGFVKSIDNVSGNPINSNRFLIDNLMPIFLLIENIGSDINSIYLNGKTPKYYINEMFYLINSTELWDDRYNYNGFYHYNSSNTKYAESNFYAILANVLIHRSYYNLGLDSSVRDRALELANLTIIDMVDNNYMWDTTDQAFYHNADNDWNTGGAGQNYYHLSTNAMGIITLLEFWVESGMEPDSIYLQRAKELYSSLDENLWDSSNNLYMKIAQPGWSIFDSSLNLEDNALMMSACLKLFELSGNITYYKRALNIFNSIESDLYDDVGGNIAYDFSLTNNTKSFYSNLKLSKAYLDALKIYNSTSLDGFFNVSSEIPDFIFNQDVMNLTSIYSYQKIGQFFNPINGSHGSYTIRYDITNASFNYIFKYPNKSFFFQYEDLISDPETSHTLIYDIQQSLPISDGYYIFLWANTTYFKLTDTLKRFNVASGLINQTIKGLPDILYQGPIANVSLFINYTRYDDLNLTALLEGEDIVNFPSQEVNFISNEIIQIDFNLTAKFGATPGISEIYFRIQKDSVLYLEIRKIIEIGYSFDYENLIYQSEVVKGENVLVAMNLRNFLPNASQILNVSFAGTKENTIEDFFSEEVLSENEIKEVTYYLKTSDSIINDTIRIKMSILINTTEYYSLTFTVVVMQKFEILSATFPDTIPQGAEAHLIIIIQNNQEASEAFNLYINGIQYQTNINELNTGENTIIAKIVPSINPYEFGIKKYRVVIKDSQNIDIALFYFEVNLELSTLNLILFYIVPLIIPIAIVLYYKNKLIKHKKLRR
ncbi:MAG: hypothetical protein ACFE9Z_05850 [Promethearchaeota archaeon]